MKFLLVFVVTVISVCFVTGIHSRSEITLAKNEKKILSKQEKVSIPEEDSIKQTLTDFMQISKQGKFIKLKELIAPTPVSFIKYEEEKRVEKFLKLKEGKPELGNVDMSKRWTPEELKYQAKLDTDSFPKMIKTLSKNIKAKNVYIEEFEQFWIKNNEGRVRIKLKSVNETAFSMEIDFFLSKVDDSKWKIFRFFHALPDEEYPM